MCGNTRWLTAVGAAAQTELEKNPKKCCPNGHSANTLIDTKAHADFTYNQGKAAAVIHPGRVRKALSIRKLQSPNIFFLFIDA